MKTIRLTSTSLMHTPGILRWAQHGYKFKSDRKRMLNLFMQGYGLTKECATDLLSGAMPVEVDEDSGTVTFTHHNPKQKA
jgi:hypothetical protein